MRKVRIQLEVDPWQARDTSFQLSFSVQNVGDGRVFLSTVHNPLEGLLSNCLKVKRDGRPVFYDGPLIKRIEPQADEYVFLEPGQSVSNIVDLSTCYQTSLPGRYEVTFDAYIDVIDAESEIKTEKPSLSESIQRSIRVKSEPVRFLTKIGRVGRATLGEVARRMDEESSIIALATLELKDNAKKTVLQPKLIGSSAERKKQVSAAHLAGYRLCDAALKRLKKPGARYEEWFGIYKANRYIRVETTYASTKKRMETTTFTYHLKPGAKCQENFYAYTLPGASQIWLCKQFWNAPAAGTNSKAGTVLHEHTHASAGTDDILGYYGQAKCRQLAKKSPTKAVRNADNYEYYAGG